MELFRLICSFAGEESEKSGVIGEHCAESYGILEAK
jgi:hypothetical protein